MRHSIRFCKIVLGLFTVSLAMTTGKVSQLDAHAMVASSPTILEAPQTAASSSSNRVILLAVAITILESNSGHIFRDAPGHLPKDTSDNRKLLIDTASDSKNYLGKDKYGNEWYAKTRSDLTQVWVRVRDGKITNGGVNQKAAPYDSQLGLTKPGD